MSGHMRLADDGRLVDGPPPAGPEPTYVAEPLFPDATPAIPQPSLECAHARRMAPIMGLPGPVACMDCGAPLRRGADGVWAAA